MHDFLTMWNSLSPQGKVFLSCAVIGFGGTLCCALINNICVLFALLPTFALKNEIRSHHPRLLDALQSHSLFDTVAKTLATRAATDRISHKAWRDFLASDLGNDNAIIAQKKRVVRPLYGVISKVGKLALLFILLATIGGLGLLFVSQSFGRPVFHY